jgi:hypothetical protein
MCTCITQVYPCTTCTLMCMLTCVFQEILLNLAINTFVFIILETILCCTMHDVNPESKTWPIPKGKE